MAIALADVLDPKHVQLTLRSRTAENAIRELVALLSANEQVEEPDRFADRLSAGKRSIRVW
jgi:mannitol/fructose-specific phosphotransferase system IIA component (Ntr-type)